MSVQMRLFQPEIDLQAVIALHSRAWAGNGPATAWYVGNVSWRLRRDWEVSNQVWQAENGEIVGFADYGPGGGFEILCAPELIGSPIHQQMLDAMEAEMRRVMSPDAPFEAETRAAAEDLALIAFIARNGYVKTSECALDMVQSLERTVEAPVLPPGFQIRSLKGEEEAEARVAIHGAVFGVVTPDRYIAIMRLPSYRQELDLVIVAPDGQLVGFCLCWLDDRDEVGQFEPVGIHPDYRRLGLGKAVLIEGLRRLKAAGARTAYVVPEDGEDHLIQFYASAGFQRGRFHFNYAKTLTKA